MDVRQEERGAPDPTGTHAGRAWGHVGVDCVCTNHQGGASLGRWQTDTAREHQADPALAITYRWTYPVFHERRAATLRRGLAGGVWPDRRAATHGQAGPPTER